jgi:hypothetical protein
MGNVDRDLVSELRALVEECDASMATQRRVRARLALLLGVVAADAAVSEAGGRSPQPG